MYREVELMVTLTRTNPHVVSYFDRFVRTDAATGERRHCIMMEYVRGLNMLDYVKKKKPVSNLVVYWFLRSALEALAHLHEMRVAHRDIKPENYIVAPYRLGADGSMVQRLVTIDFGLGSFLKRGGQLYINDAEEVVGTPNYSSPQVIDADNAGELWLDAKSDDVWALGASFYYLCTGKHVASFLPGGSWSRSWKEVMKFQCPDVVWSHHALLNAVITAALSKDHEKRPSAAELLEMLMTGWRQEDERASLAVPVATTPLAAKPARANGGAKRPQPDAPSAPSPPNGQKRPREKRKAAVAASAELAAKTTTGAAARKPLAVAKESTARYPLRSRSNK